MCRTLLAVPVPGFFSGSGGYLTQKKPLKFLTIVPKNTWPVFYALKEGITAQYPDTMVNEREARSSSSGVVVDASPPLLSFERSSRSMVEGVAHRLQQKRVARSVFLFLPR